MDQKNIDIFVWSYKWFQETKESEKLYEVNKGIECIQ